MSRWRYSNHGYQCATTRRGRRRTVCWARNTRIHARTARSPHILRKYVREEHKLSLEDAIRKFSALPAQRMRLTDRGVLKKGMWADIVIFDPATIRDKATFENPNQLSEGIQYVLVNGVSVVENGKQTNALPGRVLRGPGFVR